MQDEKEVRELADFLFEFNNESDRGAALNAAAVLDDWLLEILASFMVENKVSSNLLEGFNAPLGTFSARSSAAYALGLIHDNEFREITLIRKIRNEFGHNWRRVSFNTPEIAELTNKLPWLGPAEYECSSNPRARFNFAIAVLLSDLMWRARLVSRVRLKSKSWPNRSRP